MDGRKERVRVDSDGEAVGSEDTERSQIGEILRGSRKRNVKCQDVTPIALTPPLATYTSVVRAGDWIIVSGQLGFNKDGVLVEGVAAQTPQVVANLKAQLELAGAGLGDVAKTLCFLTDMDAPDTFAAFNQAYVAGFGSARPARSTVGVAALPFGGVVEIEAWAFKPE